MEQSMKSSAINYGLYLGGFTALITVIFYAIDITKMVNFWIGITLFLVVIAFGIVSTAKSKSINNGFLTFKEAFTSYFITVIIGLVISLVLNFILFNLVDPEAAEAIKEKSIEYSIQMMEGFGAPAETIAEQVEEMEAQNQYAIGSLIQGLLIQTVLYSVIGLIVAAIMKKSNPDA
jgi:hypothetical protein